MCGISAILVRLPPDPAPPPRSRCQDDPWLRAAEAITTDLQINVSIELLTESNSWATPKPIRLPSIYTSPYTSCNMLVGPPVSVFEAATLGTERRIANSRNSVDKMLQVLPCVREAGSTSARAMVWPARSSTTVDV